MTSYNEVLSFIRHFQKSRRRSPSLGDIQRKFGFKSKNSALVHVRRLESKELLETDEGYILFPPNE